MSDDTTVSQETEEIQDSQPDEVIDLETEQASDDQADDGSTGEDPEALKAEIERVKAEKADLELKNKQLYARLKKLPSKTPKTNPVPTDDLDDIRSEVKKLSQSEQKRQFGYEHGLSPEETDAVFRINSKPTKETLDDPFVKGGLQAIRAKARVASATPSSSGKSPAVNGKNWNEMSPEERAKNYQTVISKMRK